MYLLLERIRGKCMIRYSCDSLANAKFNKINFSDLFSPLAIGECVARTQGHNGNEEAVPMFLP